MASLKTTPLVVWARAYAESNRNTSNAKCPRETEGTFFGCGVTVKAEEPCQQ